MSLRFEAWTLPTSATFEKKFDIVDALTGSGVRALSEYSDESLSLPSSSDLIDEIVTDTEGSWIIAKDGSKIVDEFRADRVAIPEARPSVRQISGPQRNGLVEGIAIYPKDWPNDKEDAQDWKWGYDSILPDLSLGALGSLREEWEVALLGERYQLDVDSATGGTFTLTVGGNTTSAIDWDASSSSIASALESLSGITEVTVETTDDDVRTYWVVFESPKDLGSNMTANFGSLTGGGTLTKFNDGFDTGTDPTFTITVDGQTTQPIAWDASGTGVAGRSETLTPPGTGLQGLSNVDDVAVSGSGTFGDPWVISFYEPPDIGAFSVTFAVGSHQATKTIEGALDPSPITRSKPIDAGAGADAEYGDYGNPPIAVVTSPLDTGASWTLQVNAEARYAGSQLVLDVNPGQTYSNITVPVYPELTGKYTMVVRDIHENKIKNTSPRDVLLTAGSYQVLSIDTLTIPPGVNQIILRVAVTASDPSNVGVFYTSWETATFFEGEPEATWTEIIGQLLDAAHDRGTAEFLELDATTSADSLGNALDVMSFAAFFGGNAHLGHVLGDGAKSGYDWRVVDAANAKVITPTGSHVLQIFNTTNGEIEDQTASAGGASVTVGGKLESAETVRRIPPYTTILAHGAGALTREDSDATAESNMGRVERVFDAEPLGTDSALSAFNTARFAEESANRKAASAVVLESDSSRPLVDYEEGSKVWWNFGSNLPKEARVVRRVAWTHGNVARYEVQGSSRLTPEAAMAKAVDHLLNQPVRRRGGDGGLKASDLAGLAPLGAYIHLTASSQTIAVGGEFAEWAAVGSLGRFTFPSPSFPATEASIPVAGYYNVAIPVLEWDTWTEGGTVEVWRTHAGADQKVWPPLAATDWTFSGVDVEWKADTAHSIWFDAGDRVKLFVDHDDVSTQDLTRAYMAVYLVDRGGSVSACPILDSSVTVTSDLHEAFPGLAHDDGTYVVTYQHSSERLTFDGIARARTSTDGVAWSAPTTIFNDGTYHVASTSLTELSSGRIVAVIHVTLFGGGDLQNGVFTTYTDNVGGSWSTPEQIDSDFTSVSRGEGTLAELADGSWLFGTFGRDTGDNTDYRDVRAIKSDDDGATWSTVGTIADGQTDQRDYNSTGMIRVGSKIVAFTRENTPSHFALGGNMWRSESNDNGVTWSALEQMSPPGFTAPGGISNPIMRANGDMVLIWRDITASDNYPQHLLRSADLGQTWEVCEELTGAVGQYGSATEDASGKLAVAWGVDDSVVAGADGSIFFRKES